MRDPLFPVVCILIVLITVWLGIAGPLPDGVAGWMYKWQTLLSAGLAGTIASIAAYVAFQNTTRTLKHSESLERKRRSRKHAAVRAMLPLALSSMIDYAQSSAAALRKVLASFEGESVPRDTDFGDLPRKPPEDALKVLQEFIEYADDIDVSLMERLVAWVQIHDSRIRGLIRGVGDPSATTIVVRHNLESSIVDAAILIAGATAFFKYGRRAHEEPMTQITWDDVRSSLRNMSFWEHEHKRVFDVVERAEPVFPHPL